MFMKEDDRSAKASSQMICTHHMGKMILSSDEDLDIQNVLEQQDHVSPSPSDINTDSAK